MSEHSPGPVGSDESVVRMVVNPMFVSKKKPELLPSFFEHVFSQGLSVQRVERATVPEIKKLITEFVEPRSDRTWLGFVAAPVNSLRSVSPDDQPDLRGFCVYDTAEADNPAHAEVGIGYGIAEADRVEFRRLLMGAFAEGAIRPREVLLDGRVWNALDPEIKSRPVPQRWLSIVPGA
jgi:hypothetical protein